MNLKTAVDRLIPLDSPRGIPFDCDSHEEWAGLRVDDVDIRVTDGRTAMQVAVQSEECELALIDLPLLAVTLSDKLQPLGVAFASSASARSRQVARIRWAHHLHVCEPAP